MRVVDTSLELFLQQIHHPGRNCVWLAYMCAGDGCSNGNGNDKFEAILGGWHSCAALVQGG